MARAVSRPNGKQDKEQGNVKEDDYDPKHGTNSRGPGAPTAHDYPEIPSFLRNHDKRFPVDATELRRSSDNDAGLITTLPEEATIDDFADAMLKCSQALHEATLAIRNLAEVTANMSSMDRDNEKDPKE